MCHSIEYNCKEFVERQFDILRENDVVEKMRSDLEKYSSEIFDKKITDFVQQKIKKMIVQKLKDVNDLFH